MSGSIDLVSGRRFTIHKANYIHHSPQFMYGIRPIKSDILEGQRNDKNKDYVNSIIDYFKRLEESEKEWISFYVKTSHDKVLHSVQLSTDFVQEMCKIFHCKYEGGDKPWNKLQLKLHGKFVIECTKSRSSRSLQVPLPKEVEFKKVFDLMETLNELDETGEALNLVFDDSLNYQMIQPENIWVKKWKEFLCVKNDITSIISVSINWFQNTSTITPSSSMNGLLFDHEASKDFTLVSGNGSEVKCHKSILMIQSEMITEMLSGKETKERLIMIEMSGEGLKLFVRLLYDPNMVISHLKCEMVLELFKYFHLFEMKQLLKKVSAVLLQRGRAWYTPDVLVELYILLKRTNYQEDLRERLLRCMSLMKGEIRSCEKYQELKREDSEELFWNLLEI